ncbi:hypothetical protein OKW42_004391 [Paraburkholderia sp. WC7.3d]
MGGSRQANNQIAGGSVLSEALAICYSHWSENDAKQSCLGVLGPTLEPPETIVGQKCKRPFAQRETRCCAHDRKGR